MVMEEGEEVKENQEESAAKVTPKSVGTGRKSSAKKQEGGETGRKKKTPRSSVRKSDKGVAANIVAEVEAVKPFVSDEPVERVEEEPEL